MTATTIYSGYTEPWIDDPEWYNKPEDERVPIEFYSGETTGWTVITLNYGHDAKIKDGNGNDVYLVWQNHDGLPADLYTGSTMQDLQWWTSDYDEHPDFIDFINYEVLRIPAEEDKVVTEFVVPGTTVSSGWLPLRSPVCGLTALTGPPISRTEWSPTSTCGRTGIRRTTR